MSIGIEFFFPKMISNSDQFAQAYRNSKVTRDLVYYTWITRSSTIKPILHGPSMLAVEAKIMECSINNPVLSLLMKHLVIGQR